MLTHIYVAIWRHQVTKCEVFNGHNIPFFVCFDKDFYFLLPCVTCFPRIFDYQFHVKNVIWDKNTYLVFFFFFSRYMIQIYIYMCYFRDEWYIYIMQMINGDWVNIKIFSCQNRDPRCEGKRVLRTSYRGFIGRLPLLMHWSRESGAKLTSLLNQRDYIISNLPLISIHSLIFALPTTSDPPLALLEWKRKKGTYICYYGDDWYMFMINGDYVNIKTSSYGNRNPRCEGETILRTS